MLNVEFSDIDRILITRGYGVEKTIANKSEIQEILHHFLPIKLKGINNLDKYFSTRTGGDYFYIKIHQKNNPEKNLVIYSDGVVKYFEEDKPRNYFRTIEFVNQKVIQQFVEKYHL